MKAITLFLLLLPSTGVLIADEDHGSAAPDERTVAQTLATGELPLNQLVHVNFSPVVLSDGRRNEDGLNEGTNASLKTADGKYTPVEGDFYSRVLRNGKREHSPGGEYIGRFQKKNGIVVFVRETQTFSGTVTRVFPAQSSGYISEHDPFMTQATVRLDSTGEQVSVYFSASTDVCCSSAPKLKVGEHARFTADLTDDTDYQGRLPQGKYQVFASDDVIVL